jgi:flotillin
MMMLEHMDNLAMTAAQAISNIKFDKVIVWENGSSNGTSATSNFLQSMSRSLPPMLQVMKDIGGIEVPEYLAKLTPDAGGSPAATATAAAAPVSDGKAASSSEPPIPLGLEGAAVAAPAAGPAKKPQA